jgi:hypothetical protein
LAKSFYENVMDMWQRHAGCAGARQATFLCRALRIRRPTFLPAPFMAARAFFKCKLPASREKHFLNLGVHARRFSGYGSVKTKVLLSVSLAKEPWEG